MATLTSGLLVNDEELTSLEPIFKDLMQSEYHYLIHGLTHATQATICPRWAAIAKQSDDASPFPFPGQHYLCSVEVALVVSGIKPCCIINLGMFPDYGKLWFEHVFQPWRQRYKIVLDRFHLMGKLLPDGDVAKYIENHPTAHFGGSSLVFRSDHALASKVLDVFTENRPAASRVLQEVLGFPTKEGRYQLLYQLQPPVNERLGAPPGEELCCAMVLDYTLDSTSERELIRAGEHFEMCRQALKKMGIPIGLDADGEGDISARSLAFLWLGACGGSIERYANTQYREDAYWRRDRHPYEETLLVMKQLSGNWVNYNN